MTLITPVLWETAMEQVRRTLGEEAFNSWISPISLDDYIAEENRLVMVVPNEFYRRWIQKRYQGELQAAFSQAVGSRVHLELVVKDDENFRPQASPLPAKEDSMEFDVPSPRPDNGSGAYPVQQDMMPAVSNARAYAGETSPAVSRGNDRFLRRNRSDYAVEGSEVVAPRLNPRYVFEEFVVGESNRYAHAAGIAVSDPKGKAFNPLFIYGGSGLGKTHLMHAIGHRMWEADKRLRVLYVTSEQFINGFIDSIQNKRHMEFRNAYRNVDLLLIDDVQFLTGKERTQTEFFHTFNALYDAGKKVVVTSDRPPKDLSTLEERLRSRFEWGLLVDIQPPDLETRIAILRKKAEQEGVRLPNDVILFIAERVTQNIREMEGALKRLRMTSSLHDRAIDLEIARDVLGHLIMGSRSRASPSRTSSGPCAIISASAWRTCWARTARRSSASRVTSRSTSAAS
jgi:chromosomal replication initiator protein DnaA